MNNNRNWLRPVPRRPRPTVEQLARGNQVREEKQRVENQRKAERAQFNSQWPEIRVNYEPKVWRDFYLRLHPDALTASKAKLQGLEDLGEEEAERKLFGILDKATFIELNLAINGQKTAQKLFESLVAATENEEDMPFESVEDLTAFLKSMAPNFKMDIRTKGWKNTGVHSRKFCQVLAQRIQLGDLIEDDNFDEIYDEFKATIEVPHPAVRAFAEKEFMSDFSSYRYLSRMVPEFKYDDGTGRLSLNKDVCLLALHLPILATLLHFNNPKWSDRSREATSIAAQYGIGFPKLGKFVGASPTTEGVQVAVFRAKMVNVKDETFRQLHTVTHFPFPYSNGSQLEAIRAEPMSLDFKDNFVTGKGPVLVENDGKKKGRLDFGNLEATLQQCRDKTAKKN